MEDFYGGFLDLDILNYAFVVLIPRKVGEQIVRNFRLIDLLNSLYKIIVKLLSKRLSSLASSSY